MEFFVILGQLFISSPIGIMMQTLLIRLPQQIEMRLRAIYNSENNEIFFMHIYLVGGAVRDKLLDYPSSENDWVVVGATPEQMVDLGFTPVGKDFPVFIHNKSGEEYALARTERKSGRGYQGFEFYTSSEITLEQDLARRDLTINAMAMDADGVEFGMPVMDKQKYLEENFEKMQGWVGKIATFKYFERTKAGSYRHPLFKCIRDYE